MFKLLHLVTTLWFARRFLPPVAARRLELTTLGLGLVLLALILFVGALASLFATAVVAAVGSTWEIPLAVGVVLLVGSALAVVGTRRALVEPLSRPRRDRN
jgi:hypothetical protein